VLNAQLGPYKKIGILSSPIFFYFKGLFRNVIAVAFQSVFYLKIYQNNIIFYFLKVIFDISVSK
jgi:hypothetical protein